MFLHKPIITTLLQRSLTTRSNAFNSTLKLIKDDDVLSETDINSILGNESQDII